MLGYLRENTGNWIIKIFLGIIVIVFVFLGVGSFNANRNDTVATIDDEPITIKEYQQAYKMKVEELRSRYGNNLDDNLLKALNTKKMTLDGLIDRKIIMNQADELNIVVSEKELQDNLMATKAFQLDGKFNLDQYRRVLQLNSLNPEIYEKSQRDQLKIAKVQDMVLSTVSVSDFEANDWYTLQNAKVAVDYLLFNPKNYTDIKVSGEQLEKYYSQNKDKYKSEAQRKAAYIKFSAQDYKADVQVTAEQIKGYYEQQIDKYQVPEKVEARHILIRVDKEASEVQVAEGLKQAQDIYQKAIKGDDFETLAKTYSQGPSKATGGYLGKFDKTSMVKPFADKAFSLKAGEIGEPVRTDFGWHVIQVIGKFDATTQTLDQVSGAIKKELEQKEIQNIAYDKAGEAFDSVIDGDDFEQVALSAGKEILKTRAFDASGQGLDVTNNRGFAAAAFELPLETISDVKQLGDDYYLIKVLEIIEPAVQELGVVADLVRKDLVAELQNENAQKEAKEALASILKAKDLVSVASTYNLGVQSTQLFTRSGNAENVENSPDFIKASFSLTPENKIYSEIISTPKGYYIIGFKEQKLPMVSEVEEKLDTVKDQILWTKKQLAFQTWMSELKKKYKIDYDPNILN